MMNFQYSLWCVVKHWLGYFTYKISKVPANWELILSTIMWLYTHRGMTDTMSLLHCIVASSYDLHACRKESKKKKNNKGQTQFISLEKCKNKFNGILILESSCNWIGLKKITLPAPVMSKENLNFLGRFANTQSSSHVADATIEQFQCGCL